MKKWFFASKGLFVAKSFLLCSSYHSNISIIINLSQMLNNKNFRQNNVAKYLRQSVTITGLNVPNFAKAIENLVAIQNMFACHIKAEDLELWAYGNRQRTMEIHRASLAIDTSYTGLTILIPCLSHWFQMLIRPDGSLL